MVLVHRDGPEYPIPTVRVQGRGVTDSFGVRSEGSSPEASVIVPVGALAASLPDSPMLEEFTLHVGSQIAENEFLIN